MTAGDDLSEAVRRAKGGDRAALETLVRAISRDVYGLALKMLWHPSDAEDAAQEILVKVVTRLDGFRGESAFRTWVYRVAANHLLTTRKRRLERQELSFDAFGEDLARGLSAGPPAAVPGVDQGLLVEEMKIGCTQGMLLCLDREHRLAYVLGEVLGLSGKDAAFVLAIDPAAFRKRLSRARDRLHTFMEGHCGLVNPARPCRCARRVDQGIRVGRLDPRRLLFAGGPRTEVREMEGLHAAAAVFRGHLRPAAPDALLKFAEEVVSSGRYRLLSEGPISHGGKSPDAPSPRITPEGGDGRK